MSSTDFPGPGGPGFPGHERPGDSGHDRSGPPYERSDYGRPYESHGSRDAGGPGPEYEGSEYEQPSHQSPYYETPQYEAPEYERPGPELPGPPPPGEPRPSHREPKRRRWPFNRHWSWKKITLIAAGVFGTGAIALVALIGVAYGKTPIPSAATLQAQQQQSIVYYRDGKTVVGALGQTDRQVLESSQIPPVVKNAVLAAEDRQFYSEPGVSPTGIARAVWSDVTGGGTQGASTITQQFVRNYYQGIGTAQTISRKIKEIFVAVKLDHKMSKDWILTQYLNTINLGRGTYGIEAASKAYFGKSAMNLDAAQAATLAAIIQLPNYYSTPDGLPSLKQRWNYVLDGMVAMGNLTTAQRAAEQFPTFIPDQQGTDYDGYKGYILQAVKNQLQNDYPDIYARLNTGGFHIVSTFDKHWMDYAQQSVNDAEKQMRASGASMPSYAHFAMAAVEPGTGEVWAEYGGPGYNLTGRKCGSCKYDAALQAQHQVGSSFKPYVLATALDNGISLDSTVDGDSPLWIPSDQTTPPSRRLVNGWYEVKNDPGDGSLGPINLTYATAQSINTAYVDLARRIGLDKVTSMAQSFGVPSGELAPYRHAAGIAIGIAPLKPVEQATTFATFAANGNYAGWHVIRKITDSAGGNVKNVVVQHRQALSSQAAADADYAMQQDTISGTAKRAALPDGRPVIGKTGTTENAEDAWFIGAIPHMSLSVAMYTDEQDNKAGGQTLNGIGNLPGYGGFWPSLVWKSFAEKAFVSRWGPDPFPPPAHVGTKQDLVPPRPKPKQTDVPHPRNTCGPNGDLCRIHPSKPPCPFPGPFCHTRTPNPTQTPNPNPSSTGLPFGGAAQGRGVRLRRTRAGSGL